MRKVTRAQGPLSGQDTIPLVCVLGPRPVPVPLFLWGGVGRGGHKGNVVSAAAVHPAAGGSGGSRVLVWLGPAGLSGSQKDQMQGEPQQSRGGRFATAQKPSVPWGSRLRGRLGKKGSRPLWAPVAPAAPEPSPPPARPASPGPVCLLFSLPPPVGPLVTGFRAHPKPGGPHLKAFTLIRPEKQGHI